MSVVPVPRGAAPEPQSTIHRSRIDQVELAAAYPGGVTIGFDPVTRETTFCLDDEVAEFRSKAASGAGALAEFKAWLKVRA